MRNSAEHQLCSALKSTPVYRLEPVPWTNADCSVREPTRYPNHFEDFLKLHFINKCRTGWRGGTISEPWYAIPQEASLRVFLVVAALIPVVKVCIIKEYKF